MSRRRALLIGLAGLWLAFQTTAVGAQELEVRVGRGPHYVGIPIDIEVHSEGFARDPEPECSATAQRGGQLRLEGVSPNISSSIRIVNGQISRSESVRFTCHFRFVASEAGRLPIGPFAMKQGQNEQRTQAYRIEVAQVPIDGRMKVRLRVPSDPVYLGQRVPVVIEWWLGDGLVDRIHSYTIRSPLFDMEDRVRFVDDPPAQQGGHGMVIDTPSGELRLEGSGERVTEGGVDYFVLRAERTMIPLRPGTFELGAAHVQAEEVTRYSRDLFGRRSAAGTRRLLARDLVRRLEVKPPPAAGRPDSFAGAVGRGFSFDVSADRSVVQVGDPITLTFTVRGDGNMGTIGLPALEAQGGFEGESFRLPDGDVFGEVEGDTKTFVVAVRVLDESVDEIPALSYSWFDPEARRYETSESRPIALSVRPARVVAAGDVVSATPNSGEDPETGEGAAAPQGAAVAKASRRRAFALEGADLSIERDVELLRGGRRPVWQWSAAAYGSSLALLAGAFALRRRADVDPLLLRRREAFAEARRRIAAAEGQPAAVGLGELSSALRELLAVVPEARCEQSDRLLQECDDAIYAPGGASGSTDPEQVARARSLVDTFGESR